MVYHNADGEYFKQVSDIPVIVPQRYDDMTIYVKAKPGISKKTGKPIKNVLLHKQDTSAGKEVDPDGDILEKVKRLLEGSGLGGVAVGIMGTADSKTRLKLDVSLRDPALVEALIEKIKSNKAEFPVAVHDTDIMIDYACFPTPHLEEVGESIGFAVDQTLGAYSMKFHDRQQGYMVKVYAKEVWMWKCGATKTLVDDLLQQCVQNSDPKMDAALRNPHKLTNGYTRLEIRLDHDTRFGLRKKEEVNAIVKRCQRLLMGCNRTATQFSYVRHCEALRQGHAVLDMNAGQWTVSRWTSRATHCGNGVAGACPYSEDYVPNLPPMEGTRPKHKVNRPEKAWKPFMEATRLCGIHRPGYMTLVRDTKAPMKLEGGKVCRNVVVVCVPYDRNAGRTNGWAKTVTLGEGYDALSGRADGSLRRDFGEVGMIPQTTIDLVLRKAKGEQEDRDAEIIPWEEKDEQGLAAVGVFHPIDFRQRRKMCEDQQRQAKRTLARQVLSAVDVLLKAYSKYHKGEVVDASRPHQMLRLIVNKTYIVDAATLKTPNQETEEKRLVLVVRDPDDIATTPIAYFATPELQRILTDTQVKSTFHVCKIKATGKKRNANRKPVAIVECEIAPDELAAGAAHRGSERREEKGEGKVKSTPNRKRKSSAAATVDTTRNTAQTDQKSSDVQPPAGINEDEKRPYAAPIVDVRGSRIDSEHKQDEKAGDEPIAKRSRCGPQCGGMNHGEVMEVEHAGTPLKHLHRHAPAE